MANESSEVRAEPGTVTTMLALLNSPIIWSAHFGGIYFVQSMTCTLTASSRAADTTVIMMTAIAIATVVAISTLSIITFGRDNWKGAPAVTRRLLQRVTVLLSLLSVFAIMATALTIMAIPPCAELR